MLSTVSTEVDFMARHRLPASSTLAAQASQVPTREAFQKDYRTVALQRGTSATIAAVSRLSNAELRALAQAPSSFDILATLAQHAVNDERQPDDLAHARLQGLQAWRQLLQQTGGLLDSAAVAELLALSPAAIHKRYKAHQLLGIREEKRRIMYPALQFADDRVVPDLSSVLKILARDHVDERAQFRFLAGANSRLDGRTPIQALNDGDLSQVLAAARTFGEHGAA